MPEIGRIRTVQRTFRADLLALQFLLLVLDDPELVALVLLLAALVLLQKLLLLEDLLLLLLLEDVQLLHLLLLLATLELGRLLGRRAVGRVVLGPFVRLLEQLQVLVIKESRRTTVDLEPVGTNEILLVKHRVVGTHKFEVSHL